MGTVQVLKEKTAEPNGKRGRRGEGKEENWGAFKEMFIPTGGRQVSYYLP
jgi:hypothetical protein